MKPTKRDLEAITSAIWRAMLEPGMGLTPGGRADGGETITSLVTITGAWNGAVIAEFPTPLADTLTRALLRGDDAPSDEEIHDALGELVNIMAGNIKALLPEPSRLSMPAVAFGSDYGMNVIGSRTIARAPFTCGGQVFTVTLVEGSSNPEPLP